MYKKMAAVLVPQPFPKSMFNPKINLMFNHLCTYLSPLLQQAFFIRYKTAVLDFFVQM